MDDQWFPSELDLEIDRLLNPCVNCRDYEAEANGLCSTCHRDEQILRERGLI